MARVNINRHFLLTIKGNGKSRYIPDEKLRGFCIKVSQIGSVAFYYRWDKPRTTDGKRQQGTSEHEQQLVRELLDALIVKNQVAGAIARVAINEKPARNTPSSAG